MGNAVWLRGIIGCSAALALAACGQPATPAPEVVPAAPTVVSEEQCAPEVVVTGDQSVTLVAGSCLTSPSGSHKLYFRGDGNLELVKAGAQVWQSGSGGGTENSRYLALQSDGNLVVMEGANVIWHAEHTGPAGRYRMAVTDAGKVEIVSGGPDGTTVWSRP